MAVIVSKKDGIKTYRILLGANLSDEDNKKADKLDEITEKEIKSLIKKLKREKLFGEDIKKIGVKAYWHIGNILAKIADNKELLNPVERPLYWENAKIYLPKELLKEDRSIHRVHLEYCYRLGKFSYNKARKLKWGEWVYLFDSPNINAELRFDKWLSELMDDQNEKFDRKAIRIFVQLLNTLIGNIDTESMTDKELFPCYQTAWLIKKESYEKYGNAEFKAYKEAILKKIKNNNSRLTEVMDNKLKPKEFAEMVLSEV